uniref:RNA-dependent RNA polymerase n=1 Tax=Streptomyces phage Scarif TaxID=3158858 RepID=A0AAU7GWX6_9CAUD
MEIPENEHDALESYILDDEQDALTHYGIIRRSGRYPYGSGKEGAAKYPWEDSGDTPVERATAFQNIVADLRAKKMTDKQIAEGFGMTTSQFRETTSLAKEVRMQADISMVRRLKYDKGMSNVAIGKRMGIPESTVRNYLKDEAKRKNEILSSTAEMLRDQVAKKKYIDIGKGVELHVGVSYGKLKSAVSLLKDEGYKLHYIKVEQLGTGKFTTLKVLAAPDTPWKEVNDNVGQIQQIRVKSSDGGKTYDGVRPPISVSSKRVKVRYAEEGGADADGVIYVRPGVKDLSLGGSRYAQVRIAVDGTHYLKGMAMYRDDLPDGVDLMFNTNKSNTGNKLDAMKKMKDDPNDPFGANIDDQVYKKNADGSFVRDKDGNRVVESVMNIVNKEGNWGEWSKNLSSQMLSKQKPALAQHQLDLTYESKQREFDAIMSLTNPTVKKHLLEKFADSADSSAVHLKAAHMPRQASHVILPVNSMKDTEVYAPNYRDGERVVLIRYPHGGKFEIPELTVNNRHPEAKKLLGNAPDAIGIHSKVAERLSGADFDGDTVLVIPNNHGKIQSEPALAGLKDFDPQSYKIPEGSSIPKMTPKQKAMEMGKVSNLITDMTIKGAPNSELERAVRHSMVVIDAEKHGLNYKQSAQDNGIPALMKKYQGKSTGGASTLISRATSEQRVLDRKLRPKSEGGHIDPKTGKLVYVETGVEYFNGKPKTIKSTKLAETDDAHTLVSDANTKIEKIYADHSNRLKNLANQARRELLGIPNLEYSPSANKAYAEEVKKLDAKLGLALENAPRERQAQVIANAEFRAKKEANPDMDAAEAKKEKAKALQNARLRVGAKKDLVEITPREWEAIQAGAISNNKLEAILDNTDVDKIKELATPRDKPVMDAAMKARAVAMLRNDRYTLAEVADQLGVSTSALAGLGGDR